MFENTSDTVTGQSSGRCQFVVFTPVKVLSHASVSASVWWHMSTECLHSRTELTG